MHVNVHICTDIPDTICLKNLQKHCVAPGIARPLTAIHNGRPRGPAPQNGSHFAVLDLLHLLQQSAAAPAAAPPPGDPPTEMTKSGNLETLLSEPVMKVDI